MMFIFVRAPDRQAHFVSIEIFISSCQSESIKSNCLNHNLILAFPQPKAKFLFSKKLPIHKMSRQHFGWSSAASLLLPAFCLLLLLHNEQHQGAMAYYTQHFYLPSGYFGSQLFERPSAMAAPRPAAAIRKPFFVNSVADEPRVLLVEEEMEAADDSAAGGRSRGQQQQKPKSAEQQQQQRAAVNLGEQQAIPRRQMRHLLADEFGSGRMGRQYKRMRPCFYSPIQCLMKKKRSAPEEEEEEE